MVASSVAAPVSLEARIFERLAEVPVGLTVFKLSTVENVLVNIDGEVPLDDAETPSVDSRIQHWLECDLRRRRNEHDRYNGACQEYLAQLKSYITSLEAAVNTNAA